MPNNTKTILLVTTIALAVIAMFGAGYSVLDSKATINEKIEAHDCSAQSHIHLRHAVTAVSEATGAIQDSLLSMQFQLERIKEILEEIRSDDN